MTEISNISTPAVATHTELWDRCLKIFRDNLSDDHYKSWFEPVVSKSFEGNNLVLIVPSPYFIEMLENNFANLIARTIARVYGSNVTLYFHYKQVKGQTDTGVNMRSSNPSGAVKPGNKPPNPFQTTVEETFDSQLNPRYNFGNYCESMSNKLARTIGKAIADNPKGSAYNPLFIFGPTGVGKTHLIQAIGIGIKEHNPNMRVLYINARLFESQFTVASRNGKINEFINFYQSIDVLIIDDIQDLIDKEKTQGAFFHIFNHLRLNQRQIILSSDQRPTDLRGMQERLLSRFKSGVTVELERPDLELRKEVLMLKQEQDGLDIPSEVLDYIADNITGSIRELEGVMSSLMVHATVLNQELNLDLARTVLGNAVRIAKPQVNFDIITRGVSRYYNVDADSIYTKTRKREISDARQMVMFMAKKHMKMPLKAIGSRLDRKHATVLHGCRNIEERLTFEKQLQNDVAAIEKLFVEIALES